MANNVDPIGAVLMFGDDILKKISQIDKSLTSMQKNSDKASQNFIKAIQSSYGSVDALQNRLKTAENAVYELAGASGFDSMKKRVSDVNNEITKLINELNAVRAVSSSIGGTPTNLMSIASGLGTSAQRLNEPINQEEVKYEQIRNAAWREYADNVGRTSIELERLNSMYRNGTSEIQRQAKEEQRLAEEQKKHDALVDEGLRRLQEYRRTYAGAMSFSENDGTSSLSRRRQAIQNLRAAIENLSTSDENYKEKVAALNKEIERHEAEIGKVVKGTKKLAEEQNKLSEVARQLKNAIAAAFSVQQIANFLGSIVKVRGEFEMQKKSLQALLQNKEEADLLFQKVTDLAVKSPFTVRQLTSYTKQLSAYRIESEQLYDVTKRLADVSAGLGVDMQRIILAYGQVKSANYLRGQELRQFSEAGINILKELSLYYEEVYGRAVKTSEVFDMVSKRKVYFEDVAEVFKRITSEGGTFYNMQEKQAQTIQGMVSNLKDSFDIMKNDIGTDTEGVIKGFLKTVKALADNWESLSWVIKSSLVVFGMLKIAQLNANQDAVNMIRNVRGLSVEELKGTKVNGIFANSFKAISLGLKKASASLNAFKVAFATNPVGFIIESLIILAPLIANIINQTRKAREEQQKIYTELSRNADSVRNLSESYIDLTEKMNRLESQASRTEDEERELAETEEERKAILQKINEISPDYANSLKDAEGNVSSLREEERKYNDELERRLSLEAALAGKNYGKDSLKYEKYLGKRNAAEGMIDLTYTQNRENALAIIKRVREASNATGRMLQYADALEKFVNELNPANYAQRLEQLYKSTSLLGAANLFPESIDFSSLTDYIGENNLIEDILDKTKNDLIDQINKYKSSGVYQEIIAAVTGASDENERQAAINNLIKLFDKTLDAHQLNGKLREDIQNWLATQFSDLGAFEWKIKTPMVFGYLQKQINEYVSNSVLSSMYHERGFTNPDQSEEEYGKNVLKTIQDANKEIEKLRIEGLAQQQEGLTNEERAQQIEKMVEEYTKFYNLFWGDIPENKKGGGSKKDPELERLRNILDALKDANSEYEKLRQNSTAAKSNAEVTGSFNNRFKELGILSMTNGKTFDDAAVTGLVASFREQLLSKLSAASRSEGELAIQEFLTGFTSDETVDRNKAMLERLKGNIEEMIQNLSLYKEMQKEGVTADVFTGLFGKAPETYHGISERVAMSRDAFYELGKAGEEAYAEMLSKVNKLENDHYREQLKEYVQYLRTAMNERVKIEYEGLTKMKEVDANGLLNDTQKDTIRKRIQEDMNKRLNEQTWDEFKGTDMYVNLFQDMTAQSSFALKAMRDKMVELQGSLTDLDATNMRNLVGQIDKLNEELFDRKPVEEFRRMRDEIRKMEELTGAGNEGALDSMLFGKTGDSNALANEINGIQTLISLMEDGKTMTEEEAASIGLSQKYLSMRMGLLMSILGIKKEEKEQTDAEIEDLERQKQLYNLMRSSLGRFAKSWQDMTGKIGEAVTASLEMADAMGWMEDNNTNNAFKDLGESLISLIGTIPTYIMMMKAAGVASNSALGVIGWIATGIQMVAALISKIAKIHDARIDDEIEDIEKRVQRLKDAYDEASESFDRAWDLSSLNTYNNAMKGLINQQIAERQMQIAAEQRSKKKDKDKIDEWKKEIKDLNKQLEEQQQEFLTETGGIGVDAYRSTAEAFAEAWMSAFQETGDGMDGLEEHFDSMMDDLVKKQLTLRIVRDRLEELFNYIDNEALVDGKLENDEAAQIRDIFNRSKGALSEELESLYSQLGFGTDAEGSLSGLSESLKGMTEQTAEQLAAYLNSIRTFTSQQTTAIMEAAKSILSPDASTNPIISELRQQTAVIRDIRDALHATIGDGITRGKGIRIFMQ